MSDESTEKLTAPKQKRTDEYGGSFENRTRLLFEVVAAVRSAIPQSMPLWMRISATEWMEWTGEPSWDLDQTIQLARLLPAAGIDVLDVSSGGNNENQRVDMHRYYQVSLADAVRRQMHAEGVPLLIATVGLITDAKMAAGVVQPGGEDAIDAVNAAAVGPNSRDSKPKGEDTNVSAINGTVAIDDEHGRPAHADLVLMGRQFLREPEFVLRAAHQLGVNVKWPNQYHRAPWPKDQKI